MSFSVPLLPPVTISRKYLLSFSVENCEIYISTFFQKSGTTGDLYTSHHQDEVGNYKLG